MALEIRRLIRHHRVAHRVGLVESIVGKVVYLVVDGLRCLLVNTVGDTALDSSFRIAVYEGLTLLLDLLGLLLADGPAHHVRLPQRKAAQLLENADDLLLVHDAPVGDRQDRHQPWVLIRHQLRVVLAGDKPRNGLHWSRTVQRDHGGDILNTLWLQPHAHTGHARGLDLEHARRLSSGDHVIGLRVVVRYFAQRELWLPLLHHLHGVIQHRQVPQPQKVHFQQAQLLQSRHHILAYYRIVVPCQRHIFIHRQFCDDHARRVGRCVPRHSLQCHGCVDELFDLWVLPVHIRQLLRELQRLLQGNMQRPRPCRYQLRHNIHLGVGHVQRPAHIPYGCSGGHGTEGHDLGYMVVAVLFADIFHHLTPPRVAEVHVDIRHRHTLRVQEPLEVQIVLHGVDVRDLQAVRHHRSGRAAAPWSHRYSPALGVPHKVRHNEEIVRKAHFLDHVQLIIQLLPVFRLCLTVPLSKPLIT